MTRRPSRPSRYGPVGWEVVAIIAYILVLIFMSVTSRGF